jgi:hypothetical protein
MYLFKVWGGLEQVGYVGHGPAGVDLLMFFWYVFIERLTVGGVCIFMERGCICCTLHACMVRIYLCRWQAAVQGRDVPDPLVDCRWVFGGLLDGAHLLFWCCGVVICVSM